MALITPSWFKQRQGIAEPAGEQTYQLRAPNAPEAYIAVRREGNAWTAALKASADGPDLAASAAPIETEYDAWEQAFEFYRSAYLV